MLKNKITISNISQLTSIIEETHKYFALNVQKQVNVALTFKKLAIWLLPCRV